MLGRILGMFRKDQRQLPAPPEAPPAVPGIPNISAETEVGIIKYFLEKKFGRKFQTRVRVEGYLGGEMEYRLILDDYDDSPVSNHHSVWGRSVKDVLDARHAFVDSYWRNVERGYDALTKTDLDKWDSNRAAEYRETAVAGSREEMVLRAAAEGLIR